MSLALLRYRSHSSLCYTMHACAAFKPVCRNGPNGERNKKEESTQANSIGYLLVLLRKPNYKIFLDW